jgi:hypothetical protein
MNLRRARVVYTSKLKGGSASRNSWAFGSTRQIDHGEFGEDPGGERSPGEHRAVVGGDVGCGNGLGDGEKPWDRRASFVKRSNDERARAAVTRYGCSRGESSEGCEARSRGGLRSFVLPRGSRRWSLKRTEPHDRVQGATNLRWARGVNRRSREERQGRNMYEVGILVPKDGKPSGSGRAVRISMEGNLWKTPGEELEPEPNTRVGWHLRMRPARRVREEQRAKERVLSPSLKERRRS